MSSYAILVQSIALLALSGQALSFHAKTRRGILLFQVVGISIWFIHYALISAWTGVGINSINFFITIAFLFKDQNEWIRNKYFLISCIMVLSVAMVITWQGFFSIFALLGVSLMTLAKWQDKPRMIRFIAIFAGVFWIAYDYFAGSYGGIIAELCILLSVFWSLYNEKISARNSAR